jgi:hypothetical protein
VTLEGSLKVLERLSDGEREEERGERVALSEAAARGEYVGLLSFAYNDCGRLGVPPSSELSPQSSLYRSTRPAIRPSASPTGKATTPQQDL